MALGQIPEFDHFLQSYPGMSVAPLRGKYLILRGTFDFTASSPGRPKITDSYRLEIRWPLIFPKEVPSVLELARKIPQDGKHHVNHDGTLCLGAPLRLRWKLSQYPTLMGFTDECLIPFLYSISHKEQYGTYPFGELEHGKPGVIADYLNLFGLTTEEQVVQTLMGLGTKKRLSNKRPCPCSCGKRLGVCRFHHKMNAFRKVVARSWFKSHLNKMGSDQ